MDIAFREATEGDRDWIWRATTETVWRDLSPEEKAAVDREEWETRFREETEALLKKRAPQTWVAEDDDGNRVGYVIYGSATGMFSAIPFGFVYDIYVEPGFRRMGVGRALLDKVEEFCREEGLRFLRLEASSENRIALTLYHRAGLVPERLVMVKDLRP